MRIKRRLNDKSSSDLKFTWVVELLGNEWSQWQDLAMSFVEERCKTASPSPYFWAIKQFLAKYLYICAPYASDPVLFFKGTPGHKCSSEEFKKTLEKSISPYETYRANKIATDFSDFIINKSFSQRDDFGNLIPLFQNPFSTISTPEQHSETVRNALPYRYIQDMRQILCPLPTKAELAEIKQTLQDGENLKPAYHYRHFKDWKWAQLQSGQGTSGTDGDWFEVDQELIDKSDPDCVWRTKEYTRVKVGKEYKPQTIYQLWSPVKAMIIFMKLHLPLRTYQVRLLDSGEADTWRYENGKWILNNKHDFAIGSKKNPFSKGVFRRIQDNMIGQFSTGLYINTNKTADINKKELERGYVIPWEHKEVLYWLEKLRNWQEKYNPIEKPTACTELEKKHTNQRKSRAYLESMGEVSFLFRNASSQRNDRDKPVSHGAVIPMWYSFLQHFENQLAKRGDTLDDGDRLRLVVDDTTATLFPLHSLRVSLITAYTMDTKLPLPVISKLLAGHTRLLMTIYYNKITPSVMGKKMEEAEIQLESNSKQSVRNFLKDASIEQIQCKMVYHMDESIQSALVNRNPIGWEERATGICLVGGNTVMSDEVSTLGGCWNGGELLKDSITGSHRIYESVPHGPENCIRCRWFITEARYLPALNAQFNQLSYKAHQAANLAIEIEGELEALKDELFFCEEQGKPFIKYNEMQALQRRFEKQQVEADEYAKDWIACFELINKIILVEESRAKDVSKNKLVAVGSAQDVSYAMKFVETNSELLHLSLLCEDAEFYPDLQDELRKTPAIQKRSMQLSRILMKKGFEPIFLEMDEKTQLIAANAMLRHMAKIADPDDKLEGFRKVANYLEASKYLQEYKLLDEGISALNYKVLHLQSSCNVLLEA